MTRKSLVVALALAVLAAGASSAGAAAPKLKLGFYNCYLYDYSTSSLIYQFSGRLKSGGKYEAGYGEKLSKKKSGTWKQKGEKLTFTGGMWKLLAGKVIVREGKKPGFQLTEKKNPNSTGLSCYPKGG